MDEIGFMVKFITTEGFLRVVPLGGWPPHNLLAHRVTIETGKGRVPGVIAARPFHMMTEDT